MRKKLIFVLGILIILIILIPLILYLVNRNNVSTSNVGPDPTEEFQSFLNEKITTDTYYAVLSCDDCEGVETTLSLSKEDLASQGTFILSETRLGTSDDATTVEGMWIIEELEVTQETIIVLKLPNEREVRYKQVSEEELIQVDEDGKDVLIDGERALIFLQ